MNGDNALGIVGNLREATLYGVEAGFAASDYPMLNPEMVFLTQIRPIFNLFLGQNEDNLQIFAIVGEALQRVHQHRLIAQQLKLLRHVAAHAQAFSACHNDDVIHHLTSINCLYLMPSRSSSATSSDSSWATNA